MLDTACHVCGEGEIVRSYRDVEIDNYKDSNGYDYYAGKAVISVPIENQYHCTACKRDFTAKQVMEESE